MSFYVLRSRFYVLVSQERRTTERRMSCEELDLCPNDQPRLNPLDLVRGGSELAIRVRLIGADRHHRQRRPLPEILVLDLGDRDVEFLQTVLHAPEDHPLVLQRLRTRHVKLDGQEAD